LSKNYFLAGGFLAAALAFVLESLSFISNS